MSYGKEHDYKVKLDAALATITKLTALLEAAACPNCGIEKSAMAYRHGSGWERCQWCYEVLAALKEKTDE